MEYLVIGIGLILAFLGKGIYDNVQYKKKVAEKLKREYGKVSEEEYTEEKMISLKSYYEFSKRKENDIDEITWNDLELDEVFFLINNTQSAVGEEVLYALLHKPEFNLEELKERERVIQFLSQNEEKRQKLQESLYSIGKNKRYSVFSCMEFMKNLKREKNYFHFLCVFLVLLSVGILFFSTSIGVVSIVTSVCFSFFTYFKRKGELEAYLNTVTSLIRLLYCCDDITKYDIPELKTYFDEMKTYQKHFAGFKRNYWLIGSRKPTGDLMDAIVMYLRMIFHLDLIKFNQMLKIYDKYSEELLKMYHLVGFLDAMGAVASFRALFPDATVPELTITDKPYLKTENLFHPLIDHPVKNTLREERSVLLTGSNASGKSTFLKAVAINAVLAQTIHTVLADSYSSSCFQVLSSMALRDNLLGNESYFIVEIKSLRRMLEAKRDAGEHVCTLCFVDEVLRGTNTVERIAASKEVLLGLTGDRTMVFAATHDIELTYLCEKEFSNYHFEETVSEKNVNFDYQLKTGRATSRNAIKLLTMLGYPEEIIKRAENTAEEFVKTGVWN